MPKLLPWVDAITFPLELFLVETKSFGDKRDPTELRGPAASGTPDGRVECMEENERFIAGGS